MNVSNMIPATDAMLHILEKNSVQIPNVELISVQEISKDDLYLLKTKDTVPSGFRGLVISLKEDKIVCQGSKWFAKCQFTNYEEATTALKENKHHKYQLAQDGAAVNLFLYDKQVYIATNSVCLSLTEIFSANDSGAKWNYAYTKKNNNMFNIHRFVVNELFPSYVMGDDEHIATYLGLENGNVLTIMVHSKSLLMCNKNTNIHEHFSVVNGRVYVNDRTKPFSHISGPNKLALPAVQTFETITQTIDFQRATTNQEFTNVIGEPEDEILAINKDTNQIEMCIVSNKSEERRSVCQGSTQEIDIVNDIYHFSSGRAFNVSHRVNQLFNIASVKELNKVKTIDYLMNDLGLGTTISRILLAKILDKMNKLLADKTTKMGPKMYHWFLHVMPIGYWIHGKEFAEPDFKAEDDEPYHTLLDFHGIDSNMMYAFSVKNERMEILSKVLLNLFKAVNQDLWDDLVDAVVQCFYERMYVCNLVFSGVVFVENHLNQIADSELRAKLKERVMYLMNGMDSLSARAKKYRISNRVMELPSWRVGEIFNNM